MSIEVILKAAEYIERRERGKRRRFAVFSYAVCFTYVSDVIVLCIEYDCNV